MQRFINNWSATLTAPATSGDLTLSVAPAEAAKLVGLGSGDHYLLTLAEVVEGQETAWEIVKVTGAAAGVLTVERGQEGTTAFAWSVGASISARATAAALNALTVQLADLQGRVTAAESALAALAERVTALEAPPDDGSESVDITVAVSGGYSAGFLQSASLGSSSPNSVMVPGAGAVALGGVTFFNDAPQRLSIIFNAEFSPALLASVEVQGAGTFTFAAATTAANENDGSNSFTVYEWEVTTTDWFASAGQVRTVSFFFNQ